MEEVDPITANRAGAAVSTVRPPCSSLSSVVLLFFRFPLFLPLSKLCWPSSPSAKNGAAYRPEMKAVPAAGNPTGMAAHISVHSYGRSSYGF